VKLPRRQPRSVYAVYDSDEPADGGLASDPLEDFPPAFDRDLQAASRHSASIDADPRPTVELPRASKGASTGTFRAPSTGTVIGGVLVGVGVACALAVLAIALLGLANVGPSDGGTSTSTSAHDRRLGASAARTPAPRALRVATPRRGGDLREGPVVRAARPFAHRRAVPPIAALPSPSVSAVAGSASMPHPICGCPIAEIEFGFER
jgi:hypothetical protein